MRLRDRHHPLGSNLESDGTLLQEKYGTVVICVIIINGLDRRRGLRDARNLERDAGRDGVPVHDAVCNLGRGAGTHKRSIHRIRRTAGLPLTPGFAAEEEQHRRAHHGDWDSSQCPRDLAGLRSRTISLGMYVQEFRILLHG